MPTEKASFEALKQYIPDGSYEWVMPLILQHKVHLTITRERQTKLGDYRHAWAGKNHRISVNGNLNRYAFLITLLHELAHLLAFDQYGHRIPPHGKEWKQVYSGILKVFLEQHLFPDDVAAELRAIMHNPPASSCAEENLQRILNRYDRKRNGVKLVEQLEEGKKFRISNGRVFVRGEKLRKRIKCYELPHMKIFLFSPIYEVQEILSN
jgi:SprT protein